MRLCNPPGRRAERYEADDGRQTWVIGRGELIAMKILAGRAKDLADVERMQEVDR